jgi:hypothetical protein
MPVVAATLKHLHRCLRFLFTDALLRPRVYKSVKHGAQVREQAGRASAGRAARPASVMRSRLPGNVDELTRTFQAPSLPKLLTNRLER